MRNSKDFVSEPETSFTNIAKGCKITVTAVRMRYKRLWRDGVIMARNAVNPHCLGIAIIIDLGITTAVEDAKRSLQSFLNTAVYFGTYRSFRKNITFRKEYCVISTNSMR